MFVAECPKIFHVQCICGRIFVSLEKIFVFKYSQTIFNFSFYVKYIQKKGYKIILGSFSWVPILFKWYQNISGCGTANIPCTFLLFKTSAFLQIFFPTHLLFRQVLKTSVFLDSKFSKTSNIRTHIPLFINQFASLIEQDVATDRLLKQYT